MEVPDVELDLTLEGVVRGQVLPTQVVRYPPAEFLLGVCISLALPAFHDRSEQNIAELNTRGLV
jgi:hypothetical protein